MASSRSWLRWDRRGVAGFFEDIPALIVIVTGVGIFLSSMINAFTNYQNKQYEDEPEEETQILLESVISYSKLKRSGYKDGTFDLGKLRKMTSENLTRDIHSDFEYEVKVEDVSDYPDKQNFTFNTSEKPTGDVDLIVSLHYPINIYTSTELHQKETSIHGAILTITMWK